jgi:arylsulfatase A-like enzyme
LTLSAAAGLVAAGGHVLLYLIQARLFGRHVPDSSVDFPLLAPIGYLTAFLAVGVPLAALGRWLPARITLHVVPGVLAGLTLLSLLLLNDRIYPIALFVLAVGGGVQVARAFARHPLRYFQAARRIGRGAAVGLAMVAVATLGERAARGFQLSRDRGEASPESPNVLLLILDTVRAANLGIYGHHRPTSPMLAVLGERGVIFDQAFTAASWSAPAHASMMTGLWGSENEADYLAPMKDGVATLAGTLNSHGYVAGAFMSNAKYAGRGLGLDRGFARYDDFPASFPQALAMTTLSRIGSAQAFVRGLHERKLFMLINAIRYPDFRVRREQPFERETSDVVSRFWNWRDGQERRPWFAMLNFMDAHAPYRPPGRFSTLYGEGKSAVDRYDGAIVYLDSVVGSIVEGLRARGELERTIVVVTSDHGEMHGEHDMDGHGNGAYLPVAHVPLLFAGGATPQGQRVAANVSVRDLAATILDLAGIGSHQLPGHSLRNAWTSGSNRDVSPVIIEASQQPRPSADNLTRTGTIRSAVDSSWHYILYGDGREQVFAWRTDTAESVNLIETSEGRAAGNALRRTIEETLSGVSTSKSATVHPPASGGSR